MEERPIHKLTQEPALEEFFLSPTDRSVSCSCLRFRAKGKETKTHNHGLRELYNAKQKQIIPLDHSSYLPEIDRS